MLEPRKQLWVNSSFVDRDAVQIVKGAAVYFAMVYGIGFVLGTIRVLLIVPLLGVRNAELLEQPLMLIAVFVTARWVVRHFGHGLSRPQLLDVGLIALGILLLAEVIVALVLQPVRAGDTISGLAYFLNIVAFAVMPWLISGHISKKRR
jgi:hypothetical protein